MPGFIFHSKIAHAGGQVLNFYFSQFYHDDTFELGFAFRAKAKDSDYKKMRAEYSEAKDLSISYNILTLHLYSFLSKCVRFIFGNTKMLISSLDYRNAIIRISKKAKCSWYPDVIVMDWTQTNIWAGLVRAILPNSKIIAVEHDVSFMGINRLFPLDEHVRTSFLKNEIAGLRCADTVLVFNEKDRQLLLPYLENDKIRIITPFYRRYKTNQEDFEERNGILFFGAMQRSENIEAVRFFLEHIWPLLNCKQDVVFYCVGGGVDENLIWQYVTDNVVFTGFVDDPSDYFQKAFCFIAPLLHGAGIKIKVIEGMASGIPVITNDIGIEGIPAKRARDYIHCDTIGNYVEAIDNLFSNRERCAAYAENAKALIESTFPLEQSYGDYRSIVLNLVE